MFYMRFRANKATELALGAMMVSIFGGFRVEAEPL
jgi:hypothetical protein